MKGEQSLTQDLVMQQRTFSKRNKPGESRDYYRVIHVNLATAD